VDFIDNNAGTIPDDQIGYELDEQKGQITLKVVKNSKGQCVVAPAEQPREKVNPGLPHRVAAQPSTAAPIDHR